MVFKKLKANLGLGGGAEVETELHVADVHPGDTVSGSITVKGGQLEQNVKYLEVALQARVEVESDDSEWNSDQVFHRHRVTEEFTLEPGAQHEFEFELEIPIETPFNVVCDEALDGVDIGVRTELEIARAVDSTDLDPLTIYGLPVHDAVIAAVEELGFGYTGADLEQGKIPGATLPFYQEIEYHGSERFPGISNLEVTFVTSATGTQVLFEADRRGGWFDAGGDTVGKLALPNDASDVASEVEAAITDLGRKRGLFS